MMNASVNRIDFNRDFDVKTGLLKTKTQSSRSREKIDGDRP